MEQDNLLESLNININYGGDFFYEYNKERCKKEKEYYLLNQ